ncbi:MAG: protein TolQ [Chromatiales bacterium]|nr:protein TolQ [Chromatiales bacterium]
MNEQSIWQLVTGAGPVVKIVLGLLLLASIVSWAMIADRWARLRKANAAANRFEERFWSGVDLNALFREVSADERSTHGMAYIFDAGFREFSRLHQHGRIDQEAILEGTRRAMRVATMREIDDLEQHLPYLATVGSISPYVGLFGTVWGIMNSFRSLGNVKQATLAAVAPGIAEALVATAMGLAAAIPAVIAYNRFASQVERLGNRYEAFAEEFAAILQRQLK